MGNLHNVSQQASNQATWKTSQLLQLLSYFEVSHIQ